MGPRRGFAVAVTLFALGVTGGATAGEDAVRGIDPNQGESLVEVTLSSKGAAMRLQLEADKYGVEFNDHYLRHNGDGTVTVTRLRQQERVQGARQGGLRRRRHDRGSRDLARADRRPPGRGAGREPRRERRRGRVGRNPVAHGRGRDPARRLLRELRGPLPVGGGQGSPGRRRTGRLVRGADARSLLGHRSRNADQHHAPRHVDQHRPGHHARHLHRASRARAHRRRRHDESGAAQPRPRRLEHRRLQGGGCRHVARRGPSADEHHLPEGLHDPLHGPDRGLRAVRGARGRVPEHQRAHHPAEQDERLSAQGAGHDGRHDGQRQHAPSAASRPVRSCSRRARGATRAATTSRRSSAIPACRTRR